MLQEEEPRDQRRSIETMNHALLISNLISFVATVVVVLAVWNSRENGVKERSTTISTIISKNPPQDIFVVGTSGSIADAELQFLRSFRDLQQCCDCDIDFPQGPFITTPNERIVTPHPPEPSSIGSQINCPHFDGGLSEWFPPSSGDVTLPANTRSILKRSGTGILGIVTIPSNSELIINDQDIQLDVSGMNVQGKLTIGSSTCRVSSSITITLHGNRPSDVLTNIPDPTVKGISVTGEISLHGQRFYRTWTRLAKTVQAGEDIIVVQDKVNWVPGQDIVLVTTAMKDSREWHRNEIAVVKSVAQHSEVMTVVLESPLQYQHLATSNYQGEVGLLSRSIKIQGNVASEPSDPDPLTCTDDSRWQLGDNQRPCNVITGYGGHIMVHSGGKGFVEGVELFRMGQTNVLGRYPMHFHLLGDGCSDCYFRDSSVHRSYYRCISIHGTHATHISENVAYDVTGYCYYFEDGVEENNRMEFNLGAHIHLILGPEGLPTFGYGQTIPTVRQSSTLTLPADVTASAFYITNVHNYIIGNAASGGWAGFAFPNLPEPVGAHRGVVNIRPSSVTGLTIDGNSAHSSGWWWRHAGAFYWGGSLYYNNNTNELEYNAGRDEGNNRYPCLVNKCEEDDDCDSWCQPTEQAWVRVTNTKAFLSAGVGFGSWSGRMEIVGFEAHDCALSLEALSKGFWINDMLSVCRTKTPIALPGGTRASYIKANGFKWYDTGQEHIITKATFRNCGSRSNPEHGEFDEYDQGEDRGCGDEPNIGCTDYSSVWLMLTHSDQFIPEIMQGTRDITFENCGRRFLLQGGPDTVAGREHNWIDMDGSISGLGGPSVAASGLWSAGLWWRVDDEAIYEPQAPLWFFKLNSGPERGMGHFVMEWDSDLHDQVGNSQCGNGNGLQCDYRGYIKHVGDKFANDLGLPVTANAHIVGPVGGFGWALQLHKGAPKSVLFRQIEVDPATPLLLSIPYPPGTSFTITAFARWCNPDTNLCEETFQQVNSIEAARSSLGNTYHVDSNGVLTFRIIQTAKYFLGRPDFMLPQYSDAPGGWKEIWALPRFERDGVRLPKAENGSYLTLDADCASSDGVYCSQSVSPYNRNVCPSGYSQSAYDTCISSSGGKIFANGDSG